jgi:hypothetical protein
MNNMILALDVHSLLAGLMIIYIGDSFHIVTIKFYMIYNAKNNTKLINELSYPDSHFACLASNYILSLHNGVSRIVLLGTLPTDTSTIEHVYVPYL